MRSTIEAAVVAIRWFSATASMYAMLQVPAAIQSAAARAGQSDRLCYEPIGSTLRTSRIGPDRPAPTEFFFPTRREIPEHPLPDGRQPQNRAGASISRPRFGGDVRARHVLVLASTCAFALRGVAVLSPRPKPRRHQPRHYFINLILKRRLRFVLPFRFGPTTAIRFDSQNKLAG